MDTTRWAPIPDHAVEIDGRPMLPERLTHLGGRPYVRCYLHGLIPAAHRCEDSPGDHYCGTAAHPNHVEGDDHDDQATAHGQWSHIQADKLGAIARLHRPTSAGGGESDGRCGGCDRPWPCPTAHLANGWGESRACEERGWCAHAGRRLTRT